MRMFQQSFARWILLIAIPLIGLGVGVYIYTNPPSDGGDKPPSKTEDDRPPRTHAGFHEVARQSGITFKMTFLEGEQGEKFKINLYDHGCGVVIGDFDNDGYDDVYFLNQLGKNALYRNRGDGTFEDVTEQTGVGLGDRVCVGAAFGDYDNDGYPDLFVTSTRGGNVLFHNVPDPKDPTGK